jgi:hypothetical protein
MKPFFYKTIFALALFCGLSAGMANAQSGVCGNNPKSDYAFNDCINLTSTTILNAVTSIGSDALSGGSGLAFFTERSVL